MKIYPAAPANADAWLAEEIRRAACDPGALGVFRRAASADNLNPRSLEPKMTVCMKELCGALGVCGARQVEGMHVHSRAVTEQVSMCPRC